MNVYENCPSFENDGFILRLAIEGDAQDLLKVYSDKKAAEFFNGDNCHGDNFYYTTMERMEQAVKFWRQAYENGWFVRWTVIDKISGEAVGTVEDFKRNAQDFFNDCGLLRLDLRSDYEESGKIEEILSLIVKPSFEIFGCAMVATKAVPEAKQRIAALKKLGFMPVTEKLIGFDGEQYGDYYIFKNKK